MAKANRNYTTPRLPKPVRKATGARSRRSAREVATAPKKPTSNSPAVPSEIKRQANLRALTRFDRLPPGHGTFLVPDDASAPHLRKGEYAVVDLLDREVQHGEIYVIQYESGERRRSIVQTRKDLLNITGPGAEDSLVWWVGDLRGYRKTEETVFGGIPVFAGLSDGPYLAENLQPKLLGRIVGFALASLGCRIAPEGGYRNEADGNAAFDAGEYLDVLIATGHVPSLMGNYYNERMPERRLSEEEHARVNAVRQKFVEASTAFERAKTECIRRGLVHGRRAA